MEMINNPDSSLRYSIYTEHGVFICEPVVGYFDVLTHGKLPFAHFTIKVVQKKAGELLATPKELLKNKLDPLSSERP
jgi:hypothetical protein